MKAKNEAALAFALAFSRRELLSSTVTLAVASLFGVQMPVARAEAEELLESLEDYNEGVKAKGSHITLTIPEIVENGNTVPVAVSVESPMTDDDYVESVIVLAELNPNPGLVTFKFSPSGGKAQGSARVRLVTTQTVYAVAKLSDGTLLTDQKHVKVTISGG